MITDITDHQTAARNGEGNAIPLHNVLALSVVAEKARIFTKQLNEPVSQDRWVSYVSNQKLYTPKGHNDLFFLNYSKGG